MQDAHRGPGGRGSLAEKPPWTYVGGPRAGKPVELESLKDGDSVIASAPELGGDVTLSRIGDKLTLSRTGRKDLVFSWTTGNFLEMRK